MPSRLQQTIAEYPTFTDEKLEEYLGIWNKLIAQGDKRMLDITLTMDYKPPFTSQYSLAYGEEKRALTCVQFWRVKEWLDSLRRSLNA